MVREMEIIDCLIYQLISEAKIQAEKINARVIGNLLTSNSTVEVKSL